MLAEFLIAVLLVISGSFGLIGSFGLMKLDTPMRRLHAPTKATTVGVGAALIASMLWFGVVKGSGSFEEVLIVLFLFITSPITASFIAKAHLHRSAHPGELPPTGTACDWATFDREGGD